MVAGLLAVFGYGYAEVAENGGIERIFGLSIVLIASVAIIWTCVGRDGVTTASVFAPVSLYPLLYGAYFLIPYWILITAPSAAASQLPELGLAILVGLAAFLSGCSFASRRHPRIGAMDATEACGKALLVTCWIGVILVAGLWAFRVSIGQFYTHAEFYSVGTDATSSFFENFVADLQLPLILLLGLAIHIRSRWVRAAKVTLYAYSTALFITFATASMFRSSLTVLIFAALSANFRQRLRLRQLVAISAVGVVTLFGIFLLRATNLGDDVAGSSNQAKDVLSAIATGRLSDSSAIATVLGSRDDAGEIGGRATLPLLFVQDIMAQTEAGYPFGYGRTFRHETAQLIPRAVWKDKPVFMSTQRLIRARLGMIDLDDSPNAIAQGYYELGWIGVVALHFVMGFAITAVAVRLRTVASYFVLFFMWSAYSFVDAGIYHNIAVYLRACILLFALFWLVRAVVRHGYQPPYGGPLKATTGVWL